MQLHNHELQCWEGLSGQTGELFLGDASYHRLGEQWPIFYIILWYMYILVSHNTGPSLIQSLKLQSKTNSGRTLENLITLLHLMLPASYSFLKELLILAEIDWQSLKLLDRSGKIHSGKIHNSLFLIKRG